MLLTEKRIKEVNLHTLRQEARVTVIGYFYGVDLGCCVKPQHHRVGKDRKCTCSLGADCPAVQAVADYLKAGGKRAPEPPPGYFFVILFNRIYGFQTTCPTSFTKTEIDLRITFTLPLGNPSRQS